jgi:hypothetical protein
MSTIYNRRKSNHRNTETVRQRVVERENGYNRKYTHKHTQTTVILKHDEKLQSIGTLSSERCT